MNNFKTLLCEKFLNKIVETQFVSFEFELTELRQKFEKSLTNYYKKIINMMTRIEVKNRSMLIFTLVDIFFLLKAAMLNIILRAFIRNLLNFEIKKKVTKNIINFDRSLRFIYRMIEKTRRINLKIQKLFEKNLKRNELFFYKQLIMKNLFKIKIDFFLTKYYAIKINAQIQFKFSQ